MRIGFFANAYEPTLNGVVNSIKGFKQGLESAGHEVFVFCPAYPGYNEDSINIYRFASVNLNKDLDFPLAIPRSRRIVGLVKKLDLDIIHTQHPFLLGTLGRNLGKRWDIPVLTTVHTQYEQYSHYVPFMHQGFVSAVTRRLVRKYCRDCDLILTPSASMQEYLVDNAICDIAHVVPNAVDVERFRNCPESDIRDELGLSKDDFVLGNIGRMALEKNIDFLLALMKELRVRNRSVKLVLIGGGPQLARLLADAKDMGLSQNVIFTGPVPYEHVPKYLQALDLFVMSSITEVQPLSLIESMAAGVPVLAVKAFGSQDIITDGYDGFLTELSIEEYCAHIEMSIDRRPGFLELGKNAQITALKYSIANTTRRLMELYNIAIDGRVEKNSPKAILDAELGKAQ